MSILAIIGLFTAGSLYDNVYADDLKIDYQSISIPFMQNTGQFNEDVKYYADTFAGRVFLTEKDLTYVLNADSGTYVIHEFLESGTLTDFQGLNQHDMNINYFKGDDSDKWQSHIPAYDGVSLGKVWSGVDVSLYAYGNNVEKIFTVMSGYDTSVIQLSFNGISNLQLDENGDLILYSLEDNSSVISMSAPIAYQDINGERIDISVDYKIIDDTTYGFAVGNYDESYPLVIDPVIRSTYLGGTINEKSLDVAFDSNDNVFVITQTQSSNALDDYSVTGYDPTHNGDWDIVIFKLSNDLSTIYSATYLGTTGTDSFGGITIDSNDKVFISGETDSNSFPGMDVNSAQQFYTDKTDVFVAKFSNDLRTLEQATYFGDASGYDETYSIHIDHLGNGMFIVGMTNSTTLPGIGYQTTNHGGAQEDQDYKSGIYIAKFNNDLTIAFSTFFGGNGAHSSNPSIQIDGKGLVYLEGSTNGTSWLPSTSGAYQETFSGTPTEVGREFIPDNQTNTDIFISIFDNELSTVHKSTYLGGNAYDTWMSFVIHSDGNLYMTGETYSEDFPTTSGVIYEKHGVHCFDYEEPKWRPYDDYKTDCDTLPGSNARSTFVSVLSPDLTTLISSTYIGIPYPNDPSDIGIDFDGNVYVSGQAEKENIYAHLNGGIQEIFGGDTDGYILKLTNDLTTWIQTTLLGGSGYEGNPEIYFDSTDQLFVISFTSSDDFPGQEYGADSTRAGGADIVISRVSLDLMAAYSGGSDDIVCIDCVDPTFYYSQHKIIVKDGFVYNDYSTDVTAKHTETPLLITNTNQTNVMKLKVYDNSGTNAIEWIDVGFGLSSMYHSFDDSEAIIEIRFSDNEITKLIEKDELNLVDFGNITSNIVSCGYVGINCLEVTIPHIFRDNFEYNMVVIRAEDESDNEVSNYMNDGIEIQGKSLNESPTDKIFIQKYIGNPESEWIDIQRIDRVNDIWISKEGIEFKHNGGGFQRINPIGFDNTIIN